MQPGETCPCWPEMGFGCRGSDPLPRGMLSYPAQLILLLLRHHSQGKMKVPLGAPSSGLSLCGLTPVPRGFYAVPAPHKDLGAAVTAVGPESLLHLLCTSKPVRPALEGSRCRVSQGSEKLSARGNIYLFSASAKREVELCCPFRIPG